MRGVTGDCSIRKVVVVSKRIFVDFVYGREKTLRYLGLRISATEIVLLQR